jgi:hypothetical protein
MAQEEMYRLVFTNVIVQFVYAVTSIKDHVIVIRIDKHAGSVASIGAVPSVGSQEDDLHWLLHQL